MSGGRVEYLRMELLEGITIPSKVNLGTVLLCIDKMFDFYFESVSMTYMQQHHPFKNQERL